MAGVNTNGRATRPNPAVLARLEGVLASPLAQAGLGLLAANNAAPGESRNPYAGIIGGLQRAQIAGMQNAQLSAQQAQLASQQALRDRLRTIYGGSDAAAPGVALPPVVGATPGINPTAPPPTAPPADPMMQAAQAMMQYGTPSQQLAAYNAVTAQERFRRQADREDARFQQTREDRLQQLAANRIGQYNPRDYTSESFAAFMQSRDPADLERYERVRIVDIGGVPTAVDTTTGQEIGPVGGGRDAVLRNIYDIKQAGSTGSAQGAASTAAQETLAGMDTTEAQLQQVINDPNFSQAVGPIDALTGRIGEALGTKQGVLGGQAERLANQLVIGAVADWKGAISEKELDFFLKSVPSRASSPETWSHWFHKEYLPRKERVARIARGEAFSRPQPSEPTLGPRPGAPSGTLPGGIQWRLEE